MSRNGGRDLKDDLTTNHGQIRAVVAAYRQVFEETAAMYDQLAAEMLQKAEQAREKNADPVVAEALYQWHEGYSRGLTVAAEELRQRIAMLDPILEAQLFKMPLVDMKKDPQRWASKRNKRH